VTNDEAVTGPTTFFDVAIFGTFKNYETNLRGPFVEYVKVFLKINPP
jgi:hypothetical protein